jgi:hypothetical protein
LYNLRGSLDREGPNQSRKGILFLRKSSKH